RQPVAQVVEAQVAHQREVPGPELVVARLLELVDAAAAGDARIAALDPDREHEAGRLDRGGYALERFHAAAVSGASRGAAGRRVADRWGARRVAAARRDAGN